MEDLYIVIELQKENDTLSHIITDYNDAPNAFYGFHYAAAFAAISEVDNHVVVLLNKDGAVIKREAYSHQASISGEGGLITQPKQYVVVEYQINGDQIGKLSTNHTTLSSAQNKFYTIAAAAAISSVEKHFVFMMDEDGLIVDYKMFMHDE